MTATLEPQTADPSALADWIAADPQAAFAACDDAMIQPEAQPASTREILELGYARSQAENRKDGEP